MFFFCDRDASTIVSLSGRLDSRRCTLVLLSYFLLFFFKRVRPNISYHSLSLLSGAPWFLSMHHCSRRHNSCGCTAVHVFPTHAIVFLVHAIVFLTHAGPLITLTFVRVRDDLDFAGLSPLSYLCIYLLSLSISIYLSLSLCLSVSLSPYS